MRSSANFLLQYMDMDAISPLLFHRIYNFIHAGVAELADALDLGSSVHRRAGSSPVTRTNLKSPILSGFFLFWSKIKIRHTHFLLRLCVCLSYAINALLLNCRFRHNKPTVMSILNLVKVLKNYIRKNDDTVSFITLSS